MLISLQKKMKEQKGFTLIELLAVIVILGIISAIAIPSITGLINNTKKDAHIANARQMAQSARLYVADQKVNITTTGSDITLTELISKGYMEEPKDPSKQGYNLTDSKVSVKKESSSSDKVVYIVTLKGGSTTYTNSTRNSTSNNQTSTTTLDAFDLNRDDITLP